MSAKRSALISLLLLLAGCGREAVASDESEPIYSVGTPTVKDTSYEREYVGEVHAVRYAEVRSRLKGVIEAASIDEGQSVKAGQTLFSIGARELQQELLQARAAVRSAEAELKLARLDHANTEMLFEKNVVSVAELALATSKMDALKARLDETKAKESQVAINLTYAKVQAPFDGVVNRIRHKAGSLIAEDELLTTVADTNEVYVYFRVSERDYLEYTASAPEARPKVVSLKLADGSVFPKEGVIDAVESEFNRETGNLAFRARFPNVGAILRHGSSGKVVVKSHLPGALVVSQKSTFEVQGHLFVYTVDADNRTHAQEIMPKLRLADAFVVASGLNAQDRILLEGAQKVKGGSRIHAVAQVEAAARDERQ